VNAEVVLIDLSSIAHPIWHVTQSDPDPNKASQQTVARVRSLAANHPRAAICCDSGRSFRKDIAESYKANRPPAEAMLNHQIDLAREQLAGDGFPVWALKGYEADDLIASAVEVFTEGGGAALVVSADKDLLQLVGPRVRVMNARDGSIFDAEAVKAKFGVRPDQMRDYLTLVGDSSDNIKGVAGIGPKKAADLLTRFETLEKVYEVLGQSGHSIQPACAKALQEFWPHVDVTRSLVTLRTDADLPFDEINEPRVPKEVAGFAEFDLDADDADVEAAPVQAPAGPHAAPAPEPTGLVVREPESIIVAPAQWERQLDPRSMKDARVLAKDMYDSRMFSAYGTPQAVLSTVMVGRELGLPAMASLRSIHNIEGRHALSASLMVALILKSGMAEYFDPVEFDETHAVYETQRKGARKPITLTHTIAMAMTAGLVKPNSNWVKVPTDMLVARAQSRLARMVYPDIIGSLYTPDELAELRETVAA
jgi:5'-3' exonuclease